MDDRACTERLPHDPFAHSIKLCYNIKVAELRQTAKEVAITGAGAPLAQVGVDAAPTGFEAATNVLPSEAARLTTINTTRDALGTLSTAIPLVGTVGIMARPLFQPWMTLDGGRRAA